MITEPEFYSVLVKHTNVRAAFDNAINTMTKMARAAGKPGIWAKVTTTRLVFENAFAMKELLINYNMVTGHLRTASDVDDIEKIIFNAAKNPDRQFTLFLLAATGNA